MKYFKHIKQLLVVGILLVTTSSTLSASSIEVRIEPPFGQEEIEYYCVEYRKVDKDHMPLEEWHCVWVTPDLRESIVGYTTCILTNLDPETIYEIRVHGKSAETGYWGRYGLLEVVTTPSSGNQPDIRYLRCGNFSTEYENHEDEDNVYL